MTARVLSWGATLADLLVPLKNGRLRRVVLGYADLASYRENPFYLGTTAGRNCNRIAGGKFRLGDAEYALPINDRSCNHLHGGPVGFSRRNWECVEAGRDYIRLQLISVDGDQGYPGRVVVTCEYRLVGESTLRIVMRGTTDAPTLLNLTHHSYFNLSDGQDIREHRLSIRGGFFTPSDEALVPTGEILQVHDTKYDFRTQRRIGETDGNFDINYVLDGDESAEFEAACLVAPGDDLEMRLYTDQPGLMFYSGFGLEQVALGVDGQQHGPYAGLCLEAQKFPDAVNRRHFTSPIVRPGEVYRHVSEYRFTAL